MEILNIDNLINLLPERKNDAHKGDFGTLISITGSALYRGAALLSSEAALRCGVGILKLASIEKVVSAVATSLPECTFLPLNEGENGEIILPKVSKWFEDKKATALLCGCGITNTKITKKMVCDIVVNSPYPLVLDADALNCISDKPNLLLKAKHTPIITPHIGEFARMCGISIEEIKKDKEKHALDFAQKTKCVVVLKSHQTIVATPSGLSYLLDAPNPGLSRGGSGDVLAGIIASLRAQGLNALDSAKLGVCLHSAAAKRTADRLGKVAMLPHDIIDDLIFVLKEGK